MTNRLIHNDGTKKNIHYTILIIIITVNYSLIKVELKYISIYRIDINKKYSVD